MTVGPHSHGAAALVRGVEDERSDVLAYLRRRRQGAATIGQRSAEGSETRTRAEWLVRQLDIEIDEIGRGFHEGDAAVEQFLADGQRSAEQATATETSHVSVA